MWAGAQINICLGPSSFKKYLTQTVCYSFATHSETTAFYILKENFHNHSAFGESITWDFFLKVIYRDSHRDHQRWVRTNYIQKTNNFYFLCEKTVLFRSAKGAIALINALISYSVERSVYQCVKYVWKLSRKIAMICFPRSFNIIHTILLKIFRYPLHAIAVLLFVTGQICTHANSQELFSHPLFLLPIGKTGFICVHEQK